jgi:hypothetical protein
MLQPAAPAAPGDAGASTVGSSQIPTGNAVDRGTAGIGGQVTSNVERRWLVFTLRYQPADLQARLPDRWIITGAAQEPAPIATQSTSYCRSIIERASP